MCFQANFLKCSKFKVFKVRSVATQNYKRRLDLTFLVGKDSENLILTFILTVNYGNSRVICTKIIEKFEKTPLEKDPRTYCVNKYGIDRTHLRTRGVSHVSVYTVRLKR